MEWSAKVHKTGSQVQLLKNGTVAKIIKAQADTFKPEEAHKFAATLVAALNKTAKQMTNGDAKPTVATPAEKHEIALKEVAHDAKGTDVMGKAAADLSKENVALKKKVARLEKESALERKARRGLAIAKDLVAQNKIANTEDAIKAEVMKITAMANDEIALLERKVASLPLYASKDEAAQEGRRYARLSRLHKSAADDAQSVNDIKTADAEDIRADHYAALAEQANKFAYSTEDSYKAFGDGPAPSKPDDAINQAEDVVKGTDVNGDMPKHASKAKSIYLKIAGDHEAAALVAVAAGELEKAATETEIAKEAREYASMFDKAADCAEDKEAEVTAVATKEAEVVVAKEAEVVAVAKEAEVAVVATKEAAKEDEKAEKAEEKAEKAEEKKEKAEEKKEDEVDHKAAASSYRKIATLHRKRADEFESKNDTDKADFEDKMADSADQMAAEHESMFKKLSDPVMDAPAAEPVLNAAPAPVLAPDAPAEVAPAAPVEQTAAPVMDAAPVDMNQNSEANDNTLHEDAGMDTSDLWNNDGSSENDENGDEHQDHSSENMPSDDDVNAAMHYSMGLYGENEEEAPAADEATEKQAQTRKIENISKSAGRSVDRPEHNSAASDPTVGGLEDLWRK